MKETSILALKLLLITAVVAALLGAVNMVTEPIIAKNSEATFSANMKELVPEADKFELDGTTLPAPDSGTNVEGVYCGMTNDGTPVGYVVSATSSEGYDGEIKVMVGVDSDGKITKVKVTEMSETPGLGAKCQSDWIDQYTGLGQDIKVDKNGSAGQAEYKVEAISGATITSNAVTKAVNSALSAAKVVIDDNMVIPEEGFELDEVEEPEIEESESEDSLEDIESGEEEQESESEEQEEGGAE